MACTAMQRLGGVLVVALVWTGMSVPPAHAAPEKKGKKAPEKKEPEKAADKAAEKKEPEKAPEPAAKEEPAEEKEDPAKEEARRVYLEGKEAYGKGEFAEAAKKWARTYELAPTPELL